MSADALGVVRSQTEQVATLLDVPPPDVVLRRTPDPTVPLLMKGGRPVLLVSEPFLDLPAMVRRAALAHAVAGLALGQLRSFQRLKLAIPGALAAGALLASLTSLGSWSFLIAGVIGVSVFLFVAVAVRPRWVYAADQLVAVRLGTSSMWELLEWMRANPPTIRTRIQVGPGIPGPKQRLARLRAGTGYQPGSAH